VTTKKHTVNLGDRLVEVDSIEDIDLDLEQIIHNGKRLTEADVEPLVEKIRSTGRGRPSIDGDAKGTKGHRSPQVAFRVPERLKDDLADLAKRDGVRESEVLRRALEEYIEHRRSA